MHACSLGSSDEMMVVYLFCVSVVMRWWRMNMVEYCGGGVVVYANVVGIPR